MKSDRATVAKRVEEVLQLRLAGAEVWDILQYAAEQEPPWNVGERQIRNYIAAGDKLLEQSLEKDRERLLNRHLAQRRALLARCLAVADFKTALAVIKDEADLLNLYPPKRTELTGKD